MARGHKISAVPEIPCVVGNDTEGLQKTKQAITALTTAGAYEDVDKAKTSRKLRPGKGKMRNRRHVQRLGPLVVYNEDKGITKAFRNLPGVDLAHVERLNLLQLAPGGHMGRFIVWTKGAFERLNEIYGGVDSESKQKTGYTLPRNIIANSDITRLINSDEIQSKVRPTLRKTERVKHKKNPLKNLGVMVRLNPYALSLRRAELLHQRRLVGDKKPKVKVVHQKITRKRANYKRISRDDLPVTEADKAKAEAKAAEAKEAKKEAPKDTAAPAAAAPAAAPAKKEEPAAKAAAAEAPKKEAGAPPPAKKKATSDY
jgi:large subunit ribosomal protein L4e